jgi:hypothetical protein
LDALGYLCRMPGKLRPHGRREVEHLDALTFQADLAQYFFGRFDPPAGIEITCQVMTISRQSAGRQHPVSAALKGVEHLNKVQPPGAWNLDNLEVRRVLDPQRTGQIGGGVCAMTTAKGDNCGYKNIHWIPLTIYDLRLVGHPCKKL